MGAIDPLLIPEYYQVIKNPMYLQLIKKNIRDQKYRSREEFLDDFELLRENCILYNQNRDTVWLISQADQLLIFVQDELKLVRSSPLCSFSPCQREEELSELEESLTVFK